MHAAVSRMEDPWCLTHHHFPVGGQAVYGQMLQGPVPVVVIVSAESISALEKHLVCLPTQSHPHVVLCRFPGLHLDLVRFAGVADVAVASQ